MLDIEIFAGMLTAANMGREVDQATTKRLLSSKRKVSLAEAVYAFCGDMIETEESEEVFIKEGENWVEDLAPRDEQEIANFWPKIYTLYSDAVIEVCLEKSRA